MYLNARENLGFMSPKAYVIWLCASEGASLRKNITYIILLSPFQAEPWKEPMQIISL